MIEDFVNGLLFVFIGIALYFAILFKAIARRRARKAKKLAAKNAAPAEPAFPNHESSTGNPASLAVPLKGQSGKSLFISYRREDSADITGRIYDSLAHRYGRNSLFKDVDNIPLGIDFREHLQESVGKCSMLLAVIGKNWFTVGDGTEPRVHDAKDHLRIEIESALQRNIPVIPILVQGAVMPQEGDLPASLQALAFRNGISVRPDPDFHSDMERLIRGIDGAPVSNAESDTTARKSLLRKWIEKIKTAG